MTGNRGASEANAFGRDSGARGPQVRLAPPRCSAAGSSCEEVAPPRPAPGWRRRGPAGSRPRRGAWRRLHRRSGSPRSTGRLARRQLFEHGPGPGRVDDRHWAVLAARQCLPPGPASVGRMPRAPVTVQTVHPMRPGRTAGLLGRRQPRRKRQRTTSALAGIHVFPALPGPRPDGDGDSPPAAR